MYIYIEREIDIYIYNIYIYIYIIFNLKDVRSSAAYRCASTRKPRWKPIGSTRGGVPAAQNVKAYKYIVISNIICVYIYIYIYIYIYMYTHIIFEITIYL